ncbi:MAG: threonine/serine exporter family protein [Terrimicrobiaceae bacterium]|nr:threonine/serine exporter family protein [Terrimicrobiaceae bacterium]
MELLAKILESAALASLPALGFAMLFNVPRSALGYAAGGGALARGIKTALVAGLALSPEAATLAAATALGFCGVVWARQLQAHPKVFTVAAAIPLVPGVPACNSLLAILEISQRGFSAELGEIAVENGLAALLATAAMAVGLAAPGLLFFRKKPVV